LLKQDFWFLQEYFSTKTIEILIAPANRPRGCWLLWLAWFCFPRVMGREFETPVSEAQVIKPRPWYRD
jgi:hypothetical protein